MITYCKKCDINWARLKQTQVEQDDETYEACPTCNSSLDLEDGNDIVSYIHCPISGRITNVETGELLVRPQAPVVRMPSKKKVWDETYEEFNQRKEEAETAHINEYQKLCETMSSEEAAKHAQLLIVERKFHWETTEAVNN